MRISRRTYIKSGAAIGGLLVSGALAGLSKLASAGALSGASTVSSLADSGVMVGGNGLYIQPWFEDSFLDLSDELNSAAEDGKQLVIIYEQAGCPYCKELHKVNLAEPVISKFMQKHYRVVQLDIRGSREVTDFKGKTMSEKEFARQWQINFTPTLSFFPADVKAVADKKGRDAEAFRLTGYWKPFHFETVLRFVKSGSYKDSTLQNYLSKRIESLKKQGRPIKIWD